MRRYELGRELGKGGFGAVRVVTSRDSGKEYACKSISKFLDVGNLSPAKQARAARPMQECEELFSNFK